MKNILIVDDSIIMRNWIKKILSNNNYNCIEAKNGLDGLNKIEQNNIDFVFLDLLMPEYDGFYLLEKLKEQKSEVPVIILSADIQISSKQKCEKLGIKEFVNKPPNKEKLLILLEKYMKKDD